MRAVHQVVIGTFYFSQKEILYLFPALIWGPLNIVKNKIDSFTYLNQSEMSLFLATLLYIGVFVVVDAVYGYGRKEGKGRKIP